jgi:hypothetical protein
VSSKEHEIYILKNKKDNPLTRPILFPNQDENLNINFMWPYMRLKYLCAFWEKTSAWMNIAFSCFGPCIVCCV